MVLHGRISRTPRISESTLRLVASLMACTLMLIPNMAILRRSRCAAVLQGRLHGFQLSYRLRKTLTITQVSIAFALAVAGISSAAAYERVGSAYSATGVRPDGLLWLRLGIRGQVDPRRYAAFLGEVRGAVGGVQGVAKAALADSVWWIAPGAGRFRAVIYRGDPLMCLSTVVSGPYFQVTGVRLRSGSDFGGNPEREVIVDEEFARRMGGDHGAVGQALRVDGEAGPRTIVGVAQHVSAFGSARTGEPQCYFPLTGSGASIASNSTTEVLVRFTEGRPWPVTSLREELRRLPGVSVYAVIPIAEAKERAFGPFRVQALLLGLYAFVGGALTLLGLHGVLSTVFAARRHEMAVRVAVGWTSRDVAAAVWKEAIRLTAAGVVAGGVVAVGLGTILSSQVFQMRPPDLAILLGTALAFLVMATLAALPVAVGAARQQPWETLKAE